MAYTVPELAQRWQITERHLWRLISLGKVKAIKTRTGIYKTRTVVTEREVKRVERVRVDDQT